LATFDAYAPIALHGPTGATAATRYAGGTASGSPGSGTFNKGDFVIAQDGNVWICTVAGSPGTWANIVGSGGPPSGAAGGVLAGTYPNPDLNTSVAGNGLGIAANILAVNVDGTSLDIAADTVEIKDTAVTPATYGDSSHVSQVTVNQKGQITSASNVAISGTTPGTGSVLQLVYRYTVAGSDKASIDTGVDTPDAGSNDFTNGDLLEIYLNARTDSGSSPAQVLYTFNNDTGSNYDLEALSAQGGTTSSTGLTAQTSVPMYVAGSGGGASYSGTNRIAIPNYRGTTFFKSGFLDGGAADSTAGNEVAAFRAFGWRNTAAISRVKVVGNGTDKLKVGSQLLIYKVLAS